MANKITGLGTVWIDGYELLKLIDTVSTDIPADPQWVAGLRYSKNLVKNLMGVNENAKTEEESL